MKFFPLINVKMPTIVGILTCMRGKNSILGLTEPNKKPNILVFYTYEHLKFHAQLSWVWNKFYNLRAKFSYSTLIVSENCILTRKLDINFWSHRSMKHRLWPNNYDCIQLPSFRCKHEPSYRTLLLIVPEKWSLTRKIDTNLFSHRNIQHGSWPIVIAFSYTLQMWT